MTTLPRPQAPPPARFSGRERAIWGWLTFFAVTIPGAPFVFWLYKIVGLGWIAAGLGVFALLCQGARWQVTISADGVAFRRWQWWVLPRKTRHFLLDAYFGPYQSLESDYAEGIEIRDHHHWEVSTDCFGPSEKSAIYQPLLGAMQAALKEARAYIDELERYKSPRLRHELFGDTGAFDLESATWNPLARDLPVYRNRVHKIRSLADRTVANIVIPPSSIFTFNEQGPLADAAWVDPRRPDFLTQVLCNGPTFVPNLGEVSAGSTLLFLGADNLTGVREVGGRYFEAQGFIIDGNEAIGFRDGHPMSFQVAETRTVAGYDLAAQTSVKRAFYLSEAWCFTLVEPVELPQITLLPGDKLYFDKSLKYPLYASHRQEIQLGRKRIKADELVFLRRNGRIHLGKSG